MKTKEYPDWLVPLKLSKELRDIGFKSKSGFYYSFEDSDLFVFSKPENYNKKCDKEKYVTVPTFEQAFSWFRKKGYEANISYDFQPNIKCFVGYSYEIIINCFLESYKGYFISYEIARKKCLENLIKYYKNENK